MTGAPSGNGVDTYGPTEAEQAVPRPAGQSYREFSELPQLDPADLDAVAFHVHHLARIVGMRAAHRAHPELVPNRTGTALD